LEDVLTRLGHEARKKALSYGSHSWDHVERVHNLCLIIGEREGADLQVLSAAALLHDIGRSKTGDHASQSAREAAKLLKRLGMPQNLTARITQAILSHSYSGGRTPSSLEARILSDADKLDAMGAVGVYRAATFAAQRRVGLSEMLKHFNEKLLKLKKLMYTQTATEIAEGRHEFMIAYLKELRREVKMKG